MGMAGGISMGNPDQNTGLGQQGGLGLAPPPGGAPPGGTPPLGSAPPTQAPPSPTLPTTPQSTAPQPTPTPTGQAATPSGVSPIPQSLTEQFQNASQTQGFLGSEALPVTQQANQFLGGMFNQGINPLEQSLLGSSAALGEEAMQRQIQDIDSRFQNTPFHSALAPAELDATRGFANQLNQTAAQTALQRQSAATQVASLPFNTASQASTTIPNIGSALFNLTQQQKFADLQPGMGLFSGIPIPTPVVSQGSVIASQPGSRSGKK